MDQVSFNVNDSFADRFLFLKYVWDMRKRYDHAVYIAFSEELREKNEGDFYSMHEQDRIIFHEGFELLVHHIMTKISDEE